MVIMIGVLLSLLVLKWLVYEENCKNLKDTNNLIYVNEQNEKLIGIS